MTDSLKNRCFSFLLIICLLFTVLLAVPARAESEEPNTLEISAEHAIIFNADSGYELYAKNPNDLVYCAFLPRLMTCILLVESGVSLETQVTANYIFMTAGNRVKTSCNKSFFSVNRHYSDSFTLYR